MSYHHQIDVIPVPEKVIFVNEPWLIDDTILDSIKSTAKPEELIDKAEDNVRVYLPLDINSSAVLRRLRAVIQKYGGSNETNESSFQSDVSQLVSQVEIYDQIHYVRERMDRKHSEAGRSLMKEFVAELKEIPDGCSEIFPFDMIDELEKEYEI